MKYAVLTVLMLASTAVFAKTYEVDVAGMDCGHCAQSLEKTVLKNLLGVKTAKADYQTGKLVIQADDSTKYSEKEITDAVHKADQKYTVGKVSSK